jgi:hypothetical protein
MEWIFGLSLGVIILLILLLWCLLPSIITSVVMSNKGQSGGLGFLMGFILGWIGVVIAACMRNLNEEERRHRETLAAMTSHRESSSVPPPLLPPAEPDFRLEAIRNLKVLGKEFDEYDIELEMKNLRSKHLKAESLRRKNLERERSLGVVSSSGVIPPPLPSSVPLSSPPPLPGEFIVPPLEDHEEPDFRIEAIQKLKSIGKSFDEYDIELEIGNMKAEYFRMLEVDHKEWERELESESFLRTRQAESELQSSERPLTLAEKFCRERAAGNLRNRVIH